VSYIYERREYYKIKCVIIWFPVDQIIVSSGKVDIDVTVTSFLLAQLKNAVPTAYVNMPHLVSGGDRLTTRIKPNTEIHT
jgi:hypothetical protein